ncbi:glycosyltransferase family 4 protein [uncultured Maribacter sp.]|uniref:glycosyltransferase family 4 protein n=1 Tax=uncultured Maribacter sp. TaxID=431308 RepID=UPI0030DDAE30
MKINIAFVIYSLSSGGAERVVSTLSNGLIEKYNVFIITLVESKPFYIIDDRIKLIHLENKIPPSTNIINSILLNKRLYKKLAENFKIFQIKLAIGFMTNTNIITVFASKKAHIPVLISERNNPKLEKTSMFWKILRRIAYPLSNKLIVQTNPIRDHYLNYIKYDDISILPNPISTEHQKIRKSHKIIKENIILNVGRLAPQKGQDIIINAFSELNPKNWELHLIGDGPKRIEYQELINSLNMQSKIKIIGKISDITEYYLRSKIFVFPSRYEGFPNALTEAMFLGLPVVSSNCPTGPSELIIDSENGYLVPVDDIRLFKDKMKLLINDEPLRESIGFNASNSLNHLIADNVVAQWTIIIEENLKS